MGQPRLLVCRFTLWLLLITHSHIYVGFENNGFLPLQSFSAGGQVFLSEEEYLALIVNSSASTLIEGNRDAMTHTTLDENVT